MGLMYYTSYKSVIKKFLFVVELLARTVEIAQALLQALIITIQPGMILI